MAEEEIFDTRACMNIPKKSRPTRFTVGIIGAGVSGLAFASGLRERGIDFVIYEEKQCLPTLPGGISFGPNGVTAISHLSNAAREALLETRTQNSGKNQQGVWANFRVGPQNQKNRLVACVKTKDEKETGMCAVNHDKFLNSIYSTLQKDHVWFGMKLKHIVPQESGNMQLIFWNGNSAFVDAVVGADGIMSRTRELILSSGFQPKFAEKLVYRGVAEMCLIKLALRKRSDLEEITSSCRIHMGPSGYVMTRPIDKGNSLDVIAVVNDKTKYEKAPVPEQHEPENKSDECKKAFESWGDPILNILNLTTSLESYQVFEHYPSPRIVFAHCGLLGDAAHGIQPSQDAGGNVAMGDALVLSSLLAHALRRAGGREGMLGGNVLHHAFQAYDSVRRPRVERIARAGRELAEICTFRGQTKYYLKSVKLQVLDRFKDLWEIDMVKEVEEGMRLFELFEKRV